MPSIMSFLEAHDGVFDAEDLQIMGDAFDAACGGFGRLTCRNRETVAFRIIDGIMEGERDLIRLRDAGIAVLKRT
jgi:hypothetical protein